MGLEGFLFFQFLSFLQKCKSSIDRITSLFTHDKGHKISVMQINAEHTYALQVWDYVVIGTCLAISISIGVYFAFKDRKNQDVENYLMAGRSLSAFPVAMSLTSSFISAITILGTPGEFYVYGTMYGYVTIAFLMVALLTAAFIVPVFYDRKDFSTYAYLEDRFGTRVLRYLTTIIFVIVTILYNGVVVYAPALALEQVANIPIEVGTTVVLIVCTIYTFLGGLKAVVWTDTFQVFTMAAGFIATLIKATCYDFEGGLTEIIDIAADNGRIVNDFRLDPTIRHTFFSVIIGGTTGVWGSLYMVNQNQIQRYNSCKTIKTAQTALIMNGVAICIVGIILPGLSGLCMYAYFKDCDPVTAGWVNANDQLLSYLDLFILRGAPGLTGLYLAGALSGTLSSASSAMNSLTTVTLDDFILPAVRKYKLEATFLGNSSLISKILIVFYGIVIFITSVIAPLISGNLVQASLSINSTWGTPMLGLFCLAIFVPSCEKYGATIGLLAGLFMTNFMWFGVQFYPPGPEKTMVLPVSVEGCEGDHLLSEVVSASEYPYSDQISEGLYNFYAISYLLQGTIGTLTTFVVGCVVSFFVNRFSKKTKSK